MGSTTAEERQQHQHGADGDAEKAHVDELPALAGERPQQLEEGAPVHAHPDPHGQQGQAAQLWEEPGKHDQQTFSSSFPEDEIRPHHRVKQQSFLSFFLTGSQVGSVALQGVIGFGNEKPSYITNPLLVLSLSDTMTPQYRSLHSERRIPFVRRGEVPPQASNYVSRPSNNSASAYLCERNDCPFPRLPLPPHSCQTALMDPNPADKTSLGGYGRRLWNYNMDS